MNLSCEMATENGIRGLGSKYREKNGAHVTHKAHSVVGVWFLLLAKKRSHVFRPANLLYWVPAGCPPNGNNRLCCFHAICDE